MTANEDIPSFGVFVDPSGDEVVRKLPLRWGTALPVSGEFAGDLFYKTTATVGWFYWDGGSWVGPLGAGGGGGAPTGASYVVMGLDATLTAERVLTAGAAIAIADGGPNGNATVSVPDDGITNAKLRNSVARSVIGSSAGGDPGDIAAGTGTEHCLRELGGGIAFGQLGTGGIADFAVETAKLDNSAVTFGKFQDLGPLSVFGRSINSTGQGGNISAVLSSGAVLRESAGTLGFGTVGSGGFADNSITDAKLRDSAGLSVIGRSVNSIGDPADIIAASDSTVLMRTGATLGFSLIAGGNILANTVSNLNLTDMLAGTVKGRAPTSGTGIPTDLTLSPAPGGNRVPYAGASGTLDKDWIEPHTSGAILTTTAGLAVSWVGNPSIGSLEYIIKGGGTSPTVARFGGNVFAATPVDGMRSWRTDLLCWFVFDAAVGGWLSSNIFEFPFGIDDDVAATNFLRTGELAGHALFSATIGFLVGVQAKVVGMSLNMDTSGTATIQVFDDGVAVTSAVLALAAQQSKADESLMSATIAASSILSVKVTAGAIEGPARGIIRLRRFET